MKIKKLLFIFIIVLLSFTFGCKKKNTDPYIVDGISLEKKSIHTDAQDNFLNGNYGLALVYANGKEEKSHPLPVKLTWDDASKEQYSVYLSEKSDLSDAKTYIVNTNSIEIYNLKIHTPYFYKIDDGETKGFIVDDRIIRNLYIDGLTNARDLGGYPLSDGSYTKQGMIIRLSRLNENESTELLITQNGINTLVNEFKIKAELDLRKTENNENGGITSSPLGDSVNFISFPMISGGNIILLNKDQLADLFKILGDKNNYPMIMHCSIGTDRTGAVAFILNALLGVNDDDLYYDYLFSNFANIDGSRAKSTIDNYLNVIKSQKGSSTSEKMYNYLLSVGVDKTDIDNFINICK